MSSRAKSAAKKQSMNTRSRSAAKIKKIKVSSLVLNGMPNKLLTVKRFRMKLPALKKNKLQRLDHHPQKPNRPGKALLTEIEAQTKSSPQTQLQQEERERAKRSINP